MVDAVLTLFEKLEKFDVLVALRSARTQVFGGDANTSGGIIEQLKEFLLPALGCILSDIRVAPEGQRHVWLVPRGEEPLRASSLP